MTIYYIRKGQEGPIKIGYTAGSAEKRMGQLQTGHHERLILIGTSPGELADEQSIHKELKDYNIDLEWFHSRPELLSLINEVIEGKHKWFYFRNIGTRKLEQDNKELRRLVSMQQREIESMRKQLATSQSTEDNDLRRFVKKFVKDAVPKDTMVNQLTSLRTKCREFQAVIDELREENKALKERDTVLLPVGTGERAKTRDRAHPAVLPSDNRQFSLEL